MIKKQNQRNNIQEKTQKMIELFYKASVSMQKLLDKHPQLQIVKNNVKENINKIIQKSSNSLNNNLSLQNLQNENYLSLQKKQKNFTKLKNL